MSADGRVFGKMAHSERFKPGIMINVPGRRTRRSSPPAYATFCEGNMTDYHIHTRLSADSQEEMENYCRRALELGITELCFTEHIDAGYPYDMVFMADLEAYDRQIADMRRKYPQLTLRQGLEAA